MQSALERHAANRVALFLPMSQIYDANRKRPLLLIADDLSRDFRVRTNS